MQNEHAKGEGGAKSLATLACPALGCPLLLQILAGINSSMSKQGHGSGLRKKGCCGHAVGCVEACHDVCSTQVAQARASSSMRLSQNEEGVGMLERRVLGGRCFHENGMLRALFELSNSGMIGMVETVGRHGIAKALGENAG